MMKLNFNFSKIKVEPKDLVIFIGFCILLLYLVAIGILNMAYLVSYGEFYGFVPFEAFTPSFLPTTLFFFVVALIGIFVACNSYIFEWGKKKDKGYSRWAKDSEMKKELVEVDPKSDTLTAAGVAMISDGKRLWVDNGESHNLIVGATGSGKTVIVAKPTIKILAKAGESMILTDPKGELYEETGNLLREKGYNVILLNFRDPQRGNAWNPMALPYHMYKSGNIDKAIELLDDLAKNILYDEKTSNDPFWENSGADYFSGLALGLFEDAKEEEVNLNSMNLMSTLGEERFGGPNNNYIKEYFNSKDPSRPAYVNASGTVFAPEETKGGILSTFKQKVKLFSSRDNLSEMLSYSDFDMKDIGRKKTAVFMIVQDEKKTLHPLATIFIKQCYETLIDVAQECGGHLPYRTNFILDEFANMPPLKDVTTMVTAARSRHIRFNFIIQNYAQLTQVYGKENAETIKGNCNIMYLISNELAALEEISKMCGEVKSKEKDKTASTPLVTVSDLQRLSKFEIIIMRMRMMPYKTKFTPDFKIDWGKKYEKAIYPERTKKEVKLFDIREFVKNMKKQNNPFASSPNSMFGPSPFHPFSASSMGNSSADKPASMPFDLDELTRKIDAKIAELEKEEEMEKERNLKETLENDKPIESKTESISFQEFVPLKETPDSIVSAENKKSNEILSDKNNENSLEETKTDFFNDEIDINDDQFFDDFFDDEL